MTKTILSISGYYGVEILIDVETFHYQGGYPQERGMLRNSAISFCLAHTEDEEKVVFTLRMRITKSFPSGDATEMVRTRKRISDGKSEIICFLPAGSVTQQAPEFSFKTKNK